MPSSPGVVGVEVVAEQIEYRRGEERGRSRTGTRTPAALHRRGGGRIARRGGGDQDDALRFCAPGLR